VTSSPRFDWRQFDAYLFDIDGTLLNAQGGVHYNSFHTALREVYGCNGRIDAVPVHGNTDIGILRAALEHHAGVPADFEARLPRALDVMRAEVDRNVEGIEAKVCPAIPELLAALRRDGKLLGVATGNLEFIGWIKLQRAGLRQFFDFGSFSDHNEKREEIFRHGVNLARELRGMQTSVCVVGDTPNDIRAATHLGLPVIAVATGIYTEDELVRHRPTLCLGSCAELLEISSL
jgi:phosphoglycolate phosphatase-like HAD superfamily hydrolase